MAGGGSRGRPGGVRGHGRPARVGPSRGPADAGPVSLRPGVPAEAADGDDRAEHAPGQQHGEASPRHPRLRGERTQQGLVERLHRQRAGDRGQHLGVDRHVRAGDEDQREEHQLHHRRGGLGVADQRRHRDAQRAEAGRAEHQGHRDRRPLGGGREADPVQPADEDDEQDVHHADHDAVREQAEEVHPGRQRRRADPLEQPVLPAGRQHDRQLAVAGAQHGDRGDRRDVVLHRRPAVEVLTAAHVPEERAEDRDDHDREEEREERALRVAPEAELLVADLVPQQGQVAARGARGAATVLTGCSLRDCGRASPARRRSGAGRRPPGWAGRR